VSVLAVVLTLSLTVSAGAAGGDLDTSFSGDGKLTTDFGGSESASAVALQPDGKIVVAGATSLGGGNFALARYLPNGTLDTTFSGDGKVTTNFSGGSSDYARAVALQPDGKIVVAGRVCFGDCIDLEYGPYLGLARLNSNGSPDTPFGYEEGGLFTNFGDFDDHAEAYAVALQPDGRIVVAGVAVTCDSVSLSCLHSDFGLARLNPNGTLDPTFSGDGQLTTNFGANGSHATALILQPTDGKIVVAGGSAGNFALARYHAITCNGLNVTRVGTAGNDIINGTAGADIVWGFAGNDAISGFGGNDVLCGGQGNDTLNGGDGNDKLDGSNGDDAMTGGAGTDTCSGGAHVIGDTASSCETVTGVP
jgi:uncharacterized delta-60 repeat protein